MSTYVEGIHYLGHYLGFCHVIFVSKLRVVVFFQKNYSLPTFGSPMVTFPQLNLLLTRALNSTQQVLQDSEQWSSLMANHDGSQIYSHFTPIQWSPTQMHSTQISVSLESLETTTKITFTSCHHFCVPLLISLEVSSYFVVGFCQCSRMEILRKNLSSLQLT